jgi:hypothetical protein
MIFYVFQFSVIRIDWKVKLAFALPDWAAIAPAVGAFALGLSYL